MYQYQQKTGQLQGELFLLRSLTAGDGGGKKGRFRAANSALPGAPTVIWG